MTPKNTMLKIFTLAVLLALTNEVKADSSPSLAENLDGLLDNEQLEEFLQYPSSAEHLDGLLDNEHLEELLQHLDRSDPIDIFEEDVPSNVAQPLTDSFLPISDAIFPALNTPITSETLNHVSQNIFASI